MNLFIDTTNWKLVYILEKDNVILDYFINDNIKKISDVAVEQLNVFLIKNKLKLSDIENFYLTTGPGSYTGIRVGLTIVKTIKNINPKINVYLINSLFFQVGLKNGISIINAGVNKVYLAGYIEGAEKICPQVVAIGELDIIKSNSVWSKYSVFHGYTEIDFVKNFLELKPYFSLSITDDEIKPLYIKGFF